MNRISLFRFTFEGASPCPLTPIISSSDGHIAIIFRDSVYIFNLEVDNPTLICKIKVLEYLDSSKLRQHVNSNDQSFRFLDNSKSSITCAIFTPQIPFNLSDESNLIISSYLITCLDNGMFYYWLPSYRPLKPVLSISLNHILIQHGISNSLRYFFEVSNYSNGFLKVVVSNGTLIFFWITCNKMSNITIIKENESVKHNEELKSMDTGRSRRLAAAKAIEFYTSLTVSDDESDNYVKSLESSDSEIGIPVGTEEISMLPNQQFRYIGKYSKCNSHVKESSNNILNRFDYRKPLIQNFRIPIESLEYKIIYTFNISQVDITAIKVGNIYKDTSISRDNTSCNIILSDVTGSVHLYKYTINIGLTKLFVYDQELLFISPSTLILVEVTGHSIVGFASSNQLFIGYERQVGSVNLDYQILYFRIFSLIQFGSTITCKLLIVGIKDQISYFDVKIDGKITILEGKISNSIKVPTETTYLSRDNPFKLIGLSLIPASYYFAALYHSVGLFELTLGISSDLDILNIQLMENISNYYLKPDLNNNLILNNGVVRRFHPITLPNFDCDDLPNLFSYFTNIFSTNTEASYFRDEVISKIQNYDKNDNFEKLRLIQLLSNIAYSIIIQDDIRDIILSKIDVYRRVLIINLIEYGVLNNDVMMSTCGKIPLGLVVENLKDIDKGKRLIVDCFCGEEAECQSPFEFYKCIKSHKIPSCSITRTALMGFTIGIIIPKYNHEMGKISYKTLDFCNNCRRFAIKTSLRLGCFICGNKLTTKTQLYN